MYIKWVDQISFLLRKYKDIISLCVINIKKKMFKIIGPQRENEILKPSSKLTFLPGTHSRLSFSKINQMIQRLLEEVFRFVSFLYLTIIITKLNNNNNNANSDENSFANDKFTFTNFEHSQLQHYFILCQLLIL